MSRASIFNTPDPPVPLVPFSRLDGAKLTFGDVTGSFPGDGKAVRLIVEDGLEAYLPLADLVDADKERERLTKQANKLAQEIEVCSVNMLLPASRTITIVCSRLRFVRSHAVVLSQGLEKRLAGKAFLDKAPKELVESTRAALNEKTEQLATVNKSIQDLA